MIFIFYGIPLIFAECLVHEPPVSFTVYLALTTLAFMTDASIFFETERTMDSDPTTADEC